MKEASFEAGDLWSQLRQAWTEFQDAKNKNDVDKMKKLELFINELQEKLGIKDEKDSFKQAA